MIKAVIIDYGSGNLHSANKAFVKAMGDAGLEGSVILSSNPKDLDDATHIILPGVGAFGDCIAGLRASKGMVEKLEQQVLGNKKPFLGICVGMQLLAEKGLEDGEHKGLGWIKGDVVKINKTQGFRIPQMGWNNLKISRKSKLLTGVADNADVYFVHSYHMKTDNDNIVALADYGDEITAIVEKDNIYGVQFHPEKSQQNGLKIISNFLKL
jgi:imidazole glycerol-phosphate synthase subunit HisH